MIDVSRCEFLTSSSLQSVARGHNGLLQLNAGYCLLVSNILSYLVHVFGFPNIYVRVYLCVSC